MTLDPKIMTAVERLKYRVTVGDVAAQAGINVTLAERGLVALASETSGNLQVSDTGEIAYLFPQNFRAILRNKYFRLRLQEWWSKVWAVLFYLIRISFGLFLVLSIVLIFVTIAIILIALNSSRDSDRDRSDNVSFNLPRIWVMPDLFWFFNPNPYGYDRAYSQGHPHRRTDNPDQMNFLEGVFSFLFGDGNPNAQLEERRWRQMGTVIRNHGGAVVAEQLAPYLEVTAEQETDENYMLTALTHFDGRPEVSPKGEIIYHFPELQTTARAQQQQSVPAYLREMPWTFSQASPNQIMLAIGLGALNLIGALVLWTLLGDGTLAVQLGGLVAFVQSIFWLLLSYGTAFLGIPLGRYVWIQGKNSKIEARNQQRQDYAEALNQADANLQSKIHYARKFATESVVSQDNLAYTTEQDLLEQEAARSDQIDAEWQRRLSPSE